MVFQEIQSDIAVIARNKMTKQSRKEKDTFIFYLAKETERYIRE
jgi:hypothetical protein